MSSLYKNTLNTNSGIPVELVAVLQASVFLYGKYVKNNGSVSRIGIAATVLKTEGLEIGV